MKNFVWKVVLVGVLILSVSLVACKSDEEKCEEGDFDACAKVLVKSFKDGVSDVEDGLGGMDEDDLDDALDAFDGELDRALLDANREIDEAMQDAERELNKAMGDLDNALNSL